MGEKFADSRDEESSEPALLQSAAPEAQLVAQGRQLAATDKQDGTSVGLTGKGEG